MQGCEQDYILELSEIPREAPLRPFPLAAVKLIFLRLQGKYGYLWKKLHDDWEVAERSWQDELHGVSLNAVRSAMQGLPPMLINAIDFRGRCDQAMGLLGIEDAFSAACKQNFDDPLVKLAYEKVGSRNFKTLTEVQLISKFSKAYTEVVRLHKCENIDLNAIEEINQPKQPLPYCPPNEALLKSKNDALAVINETSHERNCRLYDEIRSDYQREILKLRQGPKKTCVRFGCYELGNFLNNQGQWYCDKHSWVKKGAD
jgi:hypothetical protein